MNGEFPVPRSPEVGEIREVLAEVEQWRAAGDPLAVARVVRTEGSAPRGAGATMVVNGDGRVAGSVSGGCVEGAAVAEAHEVLREGRPRLVRFGYSDEVGFSVGLTCGGTLEIFIAPGPLPLELELEAALRAAQPVVYATVLASDGARPRSPGEALTYVPDGPDAGDGESSAGAAILVYEDGRVSGTLGNAGLDRSAVRDAAGALATGHSALRHYGPRGEARSEEVTVFLESFAPPPKMVIFGAVDFTAALSRVAKILGYHVIVCDARATFATAERFPAADEVVVEWPNTYLERMGTELTRRDAVCVLTHDSKFDIPAILGALRSRAGYIGAMGSRRTHAQRRKRLLEEGVAEAALLRVMAPIGLDLGAATPEETAISICAEIIALRNRRDPTPLRDASGPIHAATELIEVAGG